MAPESLAPITGGFGRETAKVLEEIPVWLTGFQAAGGLKGGDI